MTKIKAHNSCTPVRFSVVFCCCCLFLLNAAHKCYTSHMHIFLHIYSWTLADGSTATSIKIQHEAELRKPILTALTFKLFLY